MTKNNILTIFTRFRGRLRTTARGIAGEASADDVLQDAFCKLWTLDRLPAERVQTEKMASTVVKHLSIDYRRAAHRHDESASCGEEANDEKDQHIRELFNAVRNIIELHLNERQQQVLWKRDYEGYSFAEIAQEMGITEDNVRQILSRARKTIRNTFKEMTHEA